MPRILPFQNSDLLVRGAVGLLGSVAIAAGARRMRTLSPGGAVAAVITGTVSIAAGWSWGFLLISFFVSASALSKWGEKQKTEILGPVVGRVGERDQWQVAANGGLFCIAAFCWIFRDGALWQQIAIGALAASTADTWATETGTLARSVPRSIVSGRRVAPGTSGGLTVTGILGGSAGAFLMAALARIAGWPVSAMAVVMAGIAGAIADSLLGATIQERRWCDRCAAQTERTIHDCGTATRQSGGLRGFDNDVVNAFCTIVGGAVSVLLSRSI